jgi:DNA-binding LytR/AlgR family response regulator
MNLGADDYIVKPVHAKELIEITYKRLERIKEFKNLDSKVKPERKLSIDEKILLSIEKEHILVPVRNLVAIAVTGDYTKVYLNDGKKTIVKKALKAWEKKLPDDIFVRAHRNLIINLHHIEKLESWFNGTFSARINNYPKVVLFSKRYSQKFKKKLKNLFLSD